MQDGRGPHEGGGGGAVKHLVIVGAGGFGREMYGAALESVGYGVEFDVKGFLRA